jgi:hypothetical protein
MDILSDIEWTVHFKKHAVGRYISRNAGKLFQAIGELNGERKRKTYRASDLFKEGAESIFLVAGRRA